MELSGALREVLDDAQQQQVTGGLAQAAMVGGASPGEWRCIDDLSHLVDADASGELKPPLGSASTGPSLLADYLSSGFKVSSHCTGAKILKSFFIFGFFRSLVSLLLIFTIPLNQVNILFKLPK